jgi:hypothetical protein
VMTKGPEFRPPGDGHSVTFPVFGSNLPRYPVRE